MTNEKIEKLLHGWWVKNIHETFAYHGSSRLYEEYFKLQGFDPSSRPFSFRIRKLLDIVQRLKPFEKIISTYLKFNLDEIVPGKPLALLSASFWTTDKNFAIRFTKGERKGGEFMKGVVETIQTILKTYKNSEELQRIISKKEFKFLQLTLKWALAFRKSSRGLVLKTRLSDKAFSKVFVAWGVRGGPYTSFKKSLRYTFKKKINRAWDLKTLGEFFRHPASYSAQIVVEEKIKKKSLFFEYV